MFLVILDRTSKDNIFKQRHLSNLWSTFVKMNQFKNCVLITYMQAANAPTSLYKGTVWTELSCHFLYNKSRDSDDVFAVQTLGLFFITAHRCL